jgi:hypothetical protein
VPTGTSNEGGTKPDGGKPALIPDAFVPILVSAAATVALLGLLVRRRRHPDSGVIPAAPATQLAPEVIPAAAPQPMPRVTPLPSMRELIPEVDPSLLAEPVDERTQVVPDEVGVPRWLRPSVRAARFDGSR